MIDPLFHIETRVVALEARITALEATPSAEYIRGLLSRIAELKAGAVEHGAQRAKLHERIAELEARLKLERDAHAGVERNLEKRLTTALQGRQPPELAEARAALSDPPEADKP